MEVRVYLQRGITIKERSFLTIFKQEGHDIP